jgi:hypothetical protein
MLGFKKVILHPALLLAAGNAALAFGSAEAIAITLNILLVMAILITRWKEVRRNKPVGVPFVILALVNFITAGSVIYTNITGGKLVGLIGYAAALAYIAWGIGHLFAGRHERHDSTAKRVSENPQVYYGIGDMSAVNASGSINPFSFPFMIIGFIKSVFIGKRIETKTKTIKFIDSELTAARLYGAGYLVGAVTSLSTPYFVVAQLCWGLAYFQFKKDT